MSEGMTTLESFRAGVEFKMKQPNVDGFIEILDAISQSKKDKNASKGPMMKTIALNVLKRSFDDVTMDEVGQMETGDMVTLVQTGLEAIKAMDKMGFQETSEEPK